jgi:glycosyltransferase involved in cell wall biosynthesis
MKHEATHSMLPAREEDRVIFPAESRPRLVVIVDAEEEFDWAKPFSADNRSVNTVAAQLRAHKIFDRFGIVPTYAVDYPVAQQEAGYRPLLELMQSGKCEIGAQLHPWVTPPVEEEISERNSFASNLPADLERRKLEQLTLMIEQNFGRRPKLYRAGRYGAGRHTARILEQWGYEIDCSVLPGGPTVPLGPDYTGGTSHPYWLGESRSILEIPVTVGTLGLARRLGDGLYSKTISPLGRRLRIPAVMARLRFMERIRLTPEGSTLSESKRLTRRMLRDGHRVFVVSYHSPSLVPGNTQYVRNDGELRTFLGWLEGYMEFFFGELHGSPSTPGLIRDYARSVAPASEGGRAAVEQIVPRSLVSIIIPAHNSAPTIVRALDSVFAQTLQPHEIIVVDDCSTDDTVPVVRSYAARGVRLIELDARSGAAGARNAGIEAALGDLVAFLDSDDEWLPTKLEKQVPIIARDPRMSLVACGSNLISPEGEDLGDTYRGHAPTTGANAWRALLRSNFVATPTVIARRDRLLALGCFDHALKIGEDQDMWIRLALAGEIGYVHESLVRVHQREKSLSDWTLSDQLTFTLPMIERHVGALSDRLAHAEIAKIRGERIGRLGRVAYVTGKRSIGLRMILNSMRLGYQPFESLYYIVNASPPMVWAKRQLRGEAAR